MTANRDRHVEKIEFALQNALTYFQKTSEANAALHGATKVLYSPIVTQINEALTSLKLLSEEGQDPDTIARQGYVFNLSGGTQDVGELAKLVAKELGHNQNRRDQVV